MKPSIGRIVHYVSYGTLGGEYASECRAADVTEVDRDNSGRVGLVIKNPTGLFFLPLSEGGCLQSENNHVGGSWHWPERAE